MKTVINEFAYLISHGSEMLIVHDGVRSTDVNIRIRSRYGLFEKKDYLTGIIEHSSDFSDLFPLTYLREFPNYITNMTYRQCRISRYNLKLIPYEKKMFFYSNKYIITVEGNLITLVEKGDGLTKLLFIERNDKVGVKNLRTFIKSLGLKLTWKVLDTIIILLI